MNIEERKLEIYPSAEVPGNEEGKNSNKETNQEAVVEKAPDGWMTMTALAEELETGWKTIERIKGKLLGPAEAEDLGWVEKFKDSGGRTHWHYSPALIDEIKKKYNELVNVDIAPADWKTAGRIDKELHISYGTIKDIEKKLLEANPALGEWVGRYKKSPKGKPLVHYSPELIELIRKEYEKISRAPDGWLTLRAAEKKLQEDFNKISHGTIKRIAEELVKGAYGANSEFDSTEWVGTYRSRGHKISHYSPELIELIRKEYEKFPRAPADWKTAGRIDKELHISYGTIKDIEKKLLDEASEANPSFDSTEWVGTFRAPEGQKYLYYSPDIIGLITKESKFRGNIRSEQGIIFQYAVEIALKSIGNKNLEIQKTIEIENAKARPDFIRLATNLPEEEEYKTLILDTKLQSTTDSIKDSLKKYSQIIKKEEKGYLFFLYLTGPEVTLSQCKEDEKIIKENQGVDVRVRYYPVLELMKYFLEKEQETSRVHSGGLLPKIEQLLTGNTEPLSSDQREKIQEIYKALSYLKELVDKNQFSQDQKEQTKEKLLEKYKEVRREMGRIARGKTGEILTTELKSLNDLFPKLEPLL